MNRTRPHPQAGFSLIELLISITIGLVILIAIAIVYQTSTNLQRQREDQSEVAEPIRVASNLLRFNINHAGYVDALDAPAGTTRAQQLFAVGDVRLQNMFVRDPASPVTSPIAEVLPGMAAVFGCEGAMNGKPNTFATTVTAASPAALGCGTASGTQHSLQLAYQAVPTSTNTGTLNSLAVDNAATGEGRDCLQNQIPGNTPVVINRFFVRANDGVNELYCEGSGSASAQPIARGVEEFYLRFQSAAGGSLSNPVSAGSVKTRYVTAANVTSWPGVTAVEVCIVTATAQTGGAAATGTTALQPTRPTCTRNANGEFNANITRASNDRRLWNRTLLVYTVKNAVFSSAN